MSDEESPMIRKTISLPERLWRRIEDFQFDARVKRDTEAVRQLLELGLQAYDEQKKAPKTAR
jgi:metal-responsive CopG/Arc/MetJ family transcriptional regulator